VTLALNLANVAIFVLILVGTFLHHRRTFHVRTMIACFILDISLLIAVEIQPSGSAVQKALSAAGGGAGGDRVLLLIHVAFSAATLLLWAVQIVLGTKVLRGRMEVLPAHARGARIFLLARLGNLVTAFFL
jgi:uncharacterized membrane protein YozB (DUF420 family)